jgi:putative transcriptional regulator
MKLEDPSQRPLKSGQVLVASSALGDPNFAKSLVFLHEHQDSGSLGLILNRPLQKTVADFLPKADLPAWLRSVELFYGGPVQADQLLLVRFHADPQHNRFSFTFIPDVEHPAELGGEGSGTYKAFLGYAGWASGQLHQEVQRGDWQITSADEMMLKASGPTMWQLLVDQDDRWKNIRHLIPSHPQLN